MTKRWTVEEWATVYQRPPRPPPELARNLFKINELVRPAEVDNREA